MRRLFVSTAGVYDRYDPLSGARHLVQGGLKTMNAWDNSVAGLHHAPMGRHFCGATAMKHTITIGTGSVKSALRALTSTLRRHEPELGWDPHTTLPPTELNNAAGPELELRCCERLTHGSSAVLQMGQGYLPELVLDVKDKRDVRRLFVQATALVSLLSFSFGYDCTGSKKFVVFAIRIDYYPCLPHNTQLPESTPLGRIQGLLRASEHFVTWTVALDRTAAQLFQNRWFLSSHALTIGVNFGVDALTTAKLMCMQHIYSNRTITGIKFHHPTIDLAKGPLSVSL